MDIFKEIYKIPADKFIEELRSNPNNPIAKDFDHFLSPKFRAGQTGVSRRDLNVWRKEDLLPYLNYEKKWNRFSIIECVWLRLVDLLKKFGTDNDKIRCIKNDLFSQDPDFKREELKRMMDSPFLPDELLKLFSEINDVWTIISNDELKNELEESNFSLFTTIVILCCKLHQNFALIMNEDGEYVLINIGKPLNEIQSINVGEILKHLNNRSFLLINLYQLCTDFFENEKVMPESDYYFGLMNEFEQSVITKIRSGNYKQVTIKVQDGSITHIRLTKKDCNNEDMIRKLSRLFKTNEFKDVELSTRDGKIIKYSETDILKMNKKQ